MRYILISVCLLLAGCASEQPYKCTSRNAEICDLQNRMIRMEDAHSYPRQASTVITLTDRELEQELKRRRQTVIYPTQ